jgi:hypothetical protein
MAKSPGELEKKKNFCHEGILIKLVPLQLLCPLVFILSAIPSVTTVPYFKAQPKAWVFI